MGESGPQTSDAVVWAQRVNSRWIVHHGLKEAAEQYLDYLSRADPERLTRSCLVARRLIKEFGHAEDPKPWFYAGLFSLSTADEARRFVRDHPFTASTVPSLAGESHPASALEDVGENTRTKIRRIRETVCQMVKEHRDDPSA